MHMYDMCLTLWVINCITSKTRGISFLPLFQSLLFFFSWLLLFSVQETDSLNRPTMPLIKGMCGTLNDQQRAKATFESGCDESGSFTSVAADSRVWSARTLKFQVRHICSINNNNHVFNLNVLHVKMCIDSHVLITFLSADCNVTWEMSRTPSPMVTCTSLWSICLSYLKQLDCWFRIFNDSPEDVMFSSASTPLREQQMLMLSSQTESEQRFHRSLLKKK